MHTAVQEVWCTLQCRRYGAHCSAGDMVHTAVQEVWCTLQCRGHDVRSHKEQLPGPSKEENSSSGRRKERPAGGGGQ